MTISRHHLSRNAVRDEHIPSGEIPYGDLKADTIEIVIPFMMSAEPKSAPADSVGTKDVEETLIIPPTDMFKHLKSAQVAISYTWAPTADGAFQLYDSTAGVVRGESTAKTGGESSPWETFNVSGLVEGNSIYIRVNITTAGAAGEVVTVHRVWLLLKLGVS